MAGEHYRHIFLAGPNQERPFTNPRKGSSPFRFPPRDRALHSRLLLQKLQGAWTEAADRQAVLHADREGVYVDFFSDPGFELALKSLENLRSGIRLCNVRKEGQGDEERTIATVYVPNSKRQHFLNKIHQYEEELTGRGKPKNAKLVNSIADIRLSILQSFWQDSRELFPGEEPQWIEVWTSTDRPEIIGHFRTLLASRGIECSEGELTFPERTVLAIKANQEHLTDLIERSAEIAEMRLAKEVASFYVEMENRDQAEIVRGLVARVRQRATNNVVVALLDTGVNNGHALLRPVLANEDLHSVDAAWGVHDDPGNPHGTLMAGTAAYGDLLSLLSTSGPIFLTHRLESAKILPPAPSVNSKELWGYRTAQGLSRAEIQGAERKRIVCLAVTSRDGRDRGRPSSWSALIDELASGAEDGTRRLFIVSAGNIEESEEFRRYPASNLTNEVHDPGQSWNALTVGAFTEKVQLVHPDLKNYKAIAPSGGLSPFSTTSATWAARKWPLKPEVVVEGGNVARGPNDSIQVPDEFQLLSTYHDPQQAQFAPFGQTSAAAAQAAWMAAVIQENYPEAWPETVRALVVHSADWTDAMLRQFLPAPPVPPSKADYARLLRTCGYGVPSLERALYCASNALTLIGQAELQPYDERHGQRVTRDMHLYELPWPSEVLQSLGELEVSMRVTLSYFVEPGPGEVGWQDRYRYASHALRMAVNGPGEELEEFVGRINMQAREDGEHPGTEGPGDRWVIGDARNVGSIHSDTWRGHAADLAASNLIGIYPAVGWWRERHHLGRLRKRARYSLVVSINTPPVEVDIYTPVAVRVGVAVPVVIPTT